MTKRTFQPKTKRRFSKHGYRSRIRTHAGRLVLKRRQLKGRRRITV